MRFYGKDDAGHWALSFLLTCIEPIASVSGRCHFFTHIEPIASVKSVIAIEAFLIAESSFFFIINGILYQIICELFDLIYFIFNDHIYSRDW